MSTLVSVVMPVRNGGEYLRDAVDSILAQSYDDLELIVVDDHSSDGAIARLEQNDGRLRILNSRGSGVSAAFNTGMDHAGGAFIARMDADDIALPQRIQVQLDYLEKNPGIDICGTCIEIIRKGSVEGGNLRYQDWLNGCRTPAAIRRQIFIESPVPNPTAFFRREALEVLGGYQDPAWPEDYDLFLRADARGMKMGKPEEILLQWREHGERLTRTDHRYSLAKFQAAKIHYLVRYRLDPCVKPIIWGAGPTGRLTHDLLAEEGREVAGFLEVHPRRIGGEKRGLPVWPIDKMETDHDSFVLVAVGAAGARQKIRDFMNRVSRIEGEHYLFVA